MNVNEYILSNNHNNLLMSLMSLTQGKNSHVPGQASHCRARPLPFSIPSVSPPPSPGPVSEHQKIAQRSHVATSDSTGPVVWGQIHSEPWESFLRVYVLDSGLVFLTTWSWNHVFFLTSEFPDWLEGSFFERTHLSLAWVLWKPLPLQERNKWNNIGENI